MSVVQVFEALCGGIAVYVGVRYLLANRIPVVNEGEEKPLAWITGWGAVAVSCLVICFGLYLLALSAGVLRQPHGG